MKNFILFLSLFLVSLTVSAQTAKKYNYCGAPTKAGETCKSMVKTEGKRCHHHDDTVAKCGQPTKSGTPCRLPKVKGKQTCWRHEQ